MQTPTLNPTSLDLASVWDQALTLDGFIGAASLDHRPLWEAIRRTQRPSATALTRRLPPGTRLLVVAADWCGDAVNTIPVLANWAEQVGTELRLIDRDSWPEVMDRYETGGARAIPIVIALDPQFHELGHWGPRPLELQEWVRTHLTTMAKEERYRETRRWYARDRGETTIREVVAATTR